MIVRNKKTGKDYAISTTDWEVIKERKQAALYTVVDASELTAKRVMPMEITQIITKSKKNTHDGNIQVHSNKAAKSDGRGSSE